MPLSPLALPEPQAAHEAVVATPSVRLLGQLLAERGTATSLDHPETVTRLAQMVEAGGRTARWPSSWSPGRPADAASRSC